MKTENDNTGKAPKKGRKKTWFIFGLGLAGVLTFFGIRYFQKNKQTVDDPNAEVPDSTSSFDTPSPSVTNSSKAKTAQKHGKTKTAKGQTTSRSNVQDNDTNASDSNTRGKVLNLVNATILAKNIRSAVVKQNFTLAFDLLKNIKSVSDYSAVSTVYRTMSGNRSLVTSLLRTFNTDTQKQSLRRAFYAMGLKYNGKIWSLSGTPDQPVLITTRKTKVYRSPKDFVSVPANMVLGNEITKRGQHSVFENENQKFLVKSDHTGYYNP